MLFRSGKKRSVVTDLGILTQKLTRGGSPTHLVATEHSKTSQAHLCGQAGARRVSPRAVCRDIAGWEKQGARRLTTCPPQPPCCVGAVRGGLDLPACICLTGDWEGALQAHVTINNPYRGRRAGDIPPQHHPPLPPCFCTGDWGSGLSICVFVCVCVCLFVSP